MTAPTLVGSGASTTSATSTITAGAAVGDLAVFYALGTQTAFPNATLDVNGATDTGWTLHATVDGSGNTRNRCWSKVLTSADINSTTTYAIGPTGHVSNGTSRLVLLAYRHADGFDATSANRLVGSASHNTNVSNGSSVASISGGVRKLVAVTGVTFGAAQTTLQHTWDSDSAIDPQVSETGGTNTGTGVCQAGYKLYDTAETVDLTYNVGLNNTTHAIITVVFKTKPPPTQSVASAFATETDTAQAISHTRARTIGVATETDTARAITRASRILAIATETDTAYAIAHSRALAIGVATETDTAPGITHSVRVNVGEADHADTALPATWTKSTTLLVSLATPTAGAYATKTLRAWAYVAGVDDLADIRLALYQGATLITVSAWQALSTTVTAYTLAVGTITDYSTLRAEIVVRTSSTAVARVSQVELELSSDIGSVTETSTAIAIGHQRTRSYALATQTETAIAITHTRAVTLGTAVETSTAVQIAAHQPRDITITPLGVLTRWGANAPVASWIVGLPEA